MRVAGLLLLFASVGAAQELRAVYGGVPTQPLLELGVNAVFLGSRAITAKRLALLKQQGARVFAEFNTMHDARYLEKHPDAAPIGVNGKPCPAPHGWQGVCPTHEGYRRQRMQAFRTLLEEHALDGVWLDYHHAHASWERAQPALPDSCFCQRCLKRFVLATGVALPRKPTHEAALRLLGRHEELWVAWRCDLFTDWVTEFREILDETRPEALLGTFHCPWSETDFEGALRRKLAIDLKAQARYIDVFSPMPYHARLGHSRDPEWISRQVRWLRATLPKARIWPIVQLADWGEQVPADQVRTVLEQGARAPATGLIVFRWNGIKDQPEKLAALAQFFKNEPQKLRNTERK